MFPLWDDIPAQRIPVVNFAIIAACALVFLVEVQSPAADQIIFQYGMIPVRVVHPAQASAVVVGRDDAGRMIREEIQLQTPVPAWATLVTCMFLHGGWMHLIGNMWFLFIFGDNVEDRFGHVQYLLMYLFSGVAAGLLHVISSPGSPIPTVGASGAIGGVMGGYVLLYPHARVMSLVPLGLLTRIIPIPAIFFLGFWFLIQIVSGLAEQPGQGGVAWWAHVGGFGAGMATTFVLRSAGLLKPQPKPKLVYGFPQTREERHPWD